MSTGLGGKFGILGGFWEGNLGRRRRLREGIWGAAGAPGREFGAPQALQGGNLGRRRRSKEGIESAAGAPEAPYRGIDINLVRFLLRESRMKHVTQFIKIE